MDCILNELSLAGQFLDIDDFVKHGVTPLFEVLREMEIFGVSILYKKSDLYDCKVTQTLTFSQVIFSEESRINDEMRRLKNKLAKLQNQPFWDSEMKQQPGIEYFWIKGPNCRVTVSHTALAETAARTSHLISFSHNDFNVQHISIATSQNDRVIEIPNVWRRGQLREVLYSESAISTSQYICDKFCKKLDFKLLEEKNGFDCITDGNRSIFFNAFKKFEDLDWNQIYLDSGFDYKEFHRNKKTTNYFPPEYWSKGIFKMRINQKIRCFGYVTSDAVFHVVRIDLNHKLSDLG